MYYLYIGIVEDSYELMITYLQKHKQSEIYTYTS